MDAYSMFEYFYRDGGNWKTFGRVLLSGYRRDADSSLRTCLEWGNQFVAEQVGIPALHEAHFRSCGDGPSHLDHAFHEFLRLRPATPEQIAALPAALPLENLISRFQAAAGHWDVTKSPYYAAGDA